MINVGKLDKGFTLIEVLLAIAITAVVTLMAYNGLSAAINVAESVEANSEQLADLQLSISVLERDIRHAVNRPIIDGFGDEQVAFAGSETDEYLLLLTRTGWTNYTQTRRAELQRVGYLIEDDELWRESWLVLDRWDDDEYKQRVLLYKGIDEVNIAFLKSIDSASVSSSADIELEWLDDWPETAGTNELPEAVEIELEIRDYGKLRRLIELSGAEYIPAAFGSGSGTGSGTGGGTEDGAGDSGTGTTGAGSGTGTGNIQQIDRAGQ